jgi:hypothetical protein
LPRIHAHPGVREISDILVEIVQSPSSSGVSSTDLQRLAKLASSKGAPSPLIQATREVAKSM